MKRWPILLLACLLVPVAARGQEAPAPRLNLALGNVHFDLPAEPAGKAKPDRACPGCRARSVLWPFLETAMLQFMYNGINKAREIGDEHKTADIGPSSWLANMKAGFEWDHNAWITNQFGHPYQGSNYFTSARAHGLTYWESAGMAAFGSGTWEYFFESNKASFNDLINTTVGGTALGEVMYRLAWALRDPARPGHNEWVALAIDPMSGLAGLTSRETPTEKPPDVAGRSFTWRATSGIVWQGPTSVQLTATTAAFFDIDVQYGDVRTGKSTTPFEAFNTKIAFGGGPLADATIHGRLYGKPVGQTRRTQLTIFQTFDFQTNPAYAFGGQGFELEVGRRKELGHDMALWLSATGGGTILAAVNSLLPPPDGTTVPEPIDERDYDYGPGARWSGVFELRRHNLMFTRFNYQGYQVNVVDGRHAVHVLQRLQAEVRVPLGHDLGIGAAGEYFYRQTYFWPTGITASDRSPQFRIFMTWGKGQ